MKPRRVYQVLVKVAFTEAPPCWDQLAPALKEFWPRLEADSEEKESISNFGVVFMIVCVENLLFWSRAAAGRQAPPAACDSLRRSLLNPRGRKLPRMS